MSKEVENNQSLIQEEMSVMEVTIAEFDHEVRVKKAIDELMKSEAFKLVILDEYVKEERKSLTDFLCNGSEVAENDHDIIVAKIKATGYFKGWLDIRIRHYDGIDDPAQREALVRQLHEDEEATEKAK